MSCGWLVLSPGKSPSIITLQHHQLPLIDLPPTSFRRRQRILPSVSNSIVSGPVEHVRIRLQTQPTATASKPLLYSGPLDCVKKLYAANGVAGVFKGQMATIWRDGVGYG